MGLSETISVDVCSSHATDTNVFGQLPTQNRRLGRYFIADPVAKIILSSKGKIIAKNRAASEMLLTGFIQHNSNEMLNFGSHALNQSAEKILSELTSGRASKRRLLKRQSDDEWVVLNFALSKGGSRSEIILSIIPPKLCIDAGLKAFATAFDLTITETEIARFMVQADCPKEIAAKMNISINTVRAHLRAIYSKTGARGYNRALRLILQLVN